MSYDRNIIVGLDVGTTKVCTIVGIKSTSGDLEIIGVGTHPSHGLRKGTVVNIDKTVNSIKHSLEEARLMAGVNIESATIGIAGSHIYSFNSSGVVAIRGEEVTQQDVDRVIEAAKAVVIPSDREIIHVIPQEYRIDNTDGIKSPIGMCGVRLEANVHIVTGAVASMQNLVKCVEQAGVTTDTITLQPIASSFSVLSDEEREHGIVLVDIGGGTTDIAVWDEGSLIHSQIIPVGGNHFTNDLAVALKIPHSEAERIKINHGSVISSGLNNSAHVTVQDSHVKTVREVSLKLVSEVLEARAQELFRIINKIVKERGLETHINGGFVITGGGALIQGLAEICEFSLERNVRIGYPIPFGGMTNIMQNPKFSTVLGLLIDKANKTDTPSSVKTNQNKEFDLMARLGDSLKNVFREIF